VPIAQHRDVAALIANDTRIAGRAKADGIHIDTGLDELKAMVEKFQPKYIVGAGGLGQRHEAMLAGETGADYVFFGRLDRPENEEAHPQDLELGNWWVELFQPPCVVMAGGTLASVGEVIEAGADFIGLRDAIWTHPEGAAAAIQIANALIDADAETAA